jgi:hypothetical protein
MQENSLEKGKKLIDVLCLHVNPVAINVGQLWTNTKTRETKSNKYLTLTTYNKSYVWQFKR